MLTHLHRAVRQLTCLRNALSPQRRRARTRRRFRQFTACQGSGETLETRVLPAIAGFAVTSADSPAFHRYNATMTWTDDAGSDTTSYEIWVDQVVSAGVRNSRVLYRDNIPANGSQVTFQPGQDLIAGNYIAWVRKHDLNPAGPWVRADFQIDNDGNPSTPLPGTSTPERPEISVIRPGQGTPGQTLSESMIGWTGNDSLYDVWVNQRTPTGGWTPYSLVRNVPERAISYRVLAEGAQGNKYSYYGQIDHNSLAQLPTGDFRIFVRAVNGAVNTSGQWVGRGAWSGGVDFSYTQIEGADAVPENLRVTAELRPTVSWNSVAGADAYLVAFSKGPDYSSHLPVYLRLNGTSYTPPTSKFEWRERQLSINPGDEFYIRVRALSQDGSPIGFQPGNFAYQTITIPTSLNNQNFAAPEITGPSRQTSDTTPILRWNEVGNASTYDVWFSSLQTGSRVFVATGIEHNALHLTPSILSRYTSADIRPEIYSSDNGLADGGYRFWVRAHSPTQSAPTSWSSGYRFDVERAGLLSLELNGTGDPSTKPMVYTNVITTYEENGRKFIHLTNGRGETFSGSVLARYELGADGVPFRPVVPTADGGTQLEFPDLNMGTNVASMKVMPDGRLVILSRGSGELRLVDPVTWQIQSTYQVLDIDHGEFHDAVNLEVLDNGQILMLFNRYEKLRVFEVDAFSQLQEVDVRANASQEHGFDLTLGRGVQLEAVNRGDGTYRIFMATSSIHAITVHTYNPTLKTLTHVKNASGTPVAISRSRYSFPFLGGHLHTFKDGHGQDRSYYFSADRSGFVTWINADTLQFGFIDMATFNPKISRDPDSENFASPNDNTFDPTRITGVDDDHIAVFNNRQASVLMKLVAGTDGNLSVAGGALLPMDYGGIAITLDSGLKLLTTSSGVTVNSLQMNPTTQMLEVLESNEILLGVSVVETRSLGDDLVIKYNGGVRSVVKLGADRKHLEEFRLPKKYTVNGQTYVLDNGGTAAWEDPNNGRQFVMVTAHPQHTEFGDSDTLLVLDVTSASSPEVFAVYPIGLGLVRSATASASEIVILDRRGGAMLTVSNWQTPNAAKLNTYSFETRRIYELGRTRPGDPLIMPDGTLAIMHDTTPDRGVTVFAPGTATQDNRLANFHANNAGSFAFELSTFDADRVITVIYSGDLVIQNIRGGAIEADQPLADVDGVDVSVSAVQNFSYNTEKGIIVVNAPSTQTVGVFKVSHDGSSAPAIPLRSLTFPNVYSTEIATNGYWIAEMGYVHWVEL